MELIERFRLGYANRTLAYRLAPKQYKAGAQLRTALQRVGILRESGHEHLMARSSCRCLLLSMAALDPSWGPTAGGIGRPEHQDSGAAPLHPLAARRDSGDRCHDLCRGENQPADIRLSNRRFKLPRIALPIRCTQSR